MPKTRTASNSLLTITAAGRLAAVATRNDIAASIPNATVPAKALLTAVVAQYDGRVDAAIALLSRTLRRTSDLEAAAVHADFLAPIYISRHRYHEVSMLAATQAAAGRRAEAHSFRALVAAHGGLADAAQRHSAYALRAAERKDDDVLRFRILQRVALTSFYLHRFDDAAEQARAGAAAAIACKADRAAAACYSILYSIHHEVSGDLAEAGRYATLWREAATAAGDASTMHAAAAAEYEMSVQFGDIDEIVAYQNRIRKQNLPEAYHERYPIVLSDAIVMGFENLTGMRTLLQILRNTESRTRGEWAVCTALIAVARAADRDDDRAREELRAAISRLGRANTLDPAFEKQYRRLARTFAAVCSVMLGDSVHGQRIIHVREMESTDDAHRFLELAQGKSVEVHRSLHGAAKLVIKASALRSGTALPASLTTAEMQVLRLLACGWPATRIAAETGRSVHTVYSHTRAILSKLQASRASEAVAIARSRQIIA